MKALFVHDHYYYRDGHDVLSKGQFHNSVWQRYLDHFNDVTVIGRDGGIHQGTRDGMNIASRDHVHFALYPNVNSIKGLMAGRAKIKQALRDHIADHDVLILRGISEFGIMAFQEAKRQNKPVTIEVVGCAWDDMWNHGSIAAKLYAPYRFLMGKYMAKHADAAIYVSQKFLQNRYPSRAPIQASASNVQMDVDALRTDYPDAHQPFRIGLIGTLHNKLKGVHIAIDACSILKQRGINNLELHVLGPGDPDQSPINFNKDVLAKGLGDSVFHDGLRQSGKDVHEWLRTLDLYIQPSFQEGVPRAMIEAMGQSLPCIGSNAGGIPELIDQTCIVKSGDAKGLADKIEWMINHPDIRCTHAKRNLNEAQKYTMDQLTPIRAAFWRSVKFMALRYPQASQTSHPVLRS